MSSEIEPLCQFARRLESYLPGHSDPHSLVFGPYLVEGINNRIKVIKCTGHAFRYDHYFFLKIRAAFPGNR